MLYNLGVAITAAPAQRRRQQFVVDAIDISAILEQAVDHRDLILGGAPSQVIAALHHVHHRRALAILGVRIDAVFEQGSQYRDPIFYGTGLPPRQLQQL